ncbi:MAG: hypothetical protein JWM37_155 [Candidatus Saccharibacteria bacterium]|nr:hypothetical protein [Candidatus Saccharibacteria bacterium]
MSIQDFESRIDVRPDIEPMTNIPVDLSPEHLEAVGHLLDDSRSLTTISCELEGIHAQARQRWVRWGNSASYFILGIEIVSEGDMAESRAHPYRPQPGDIVLETKRAEHSERDMWWFRDGQANYVSPVTVTPKHLEVLPLRLSHVLNRLDLDQQLTVHERENRPAAKAARIGGSMLRALAWANISYQPPEE